MTASLFDLRGQVALVTGGTRGIGEAIALALGQSGARVMVASRKQEGVDAAVARLRAAGVTCAGAVCHTGDAAQVRALVQRCTQELGQVDVLVNNAATNPYFGPLLQLHDAALQKTLDVNLKGYFEAARAVAEHLMGRGAPGSIINIASIAALYGAPLQGIYAMTKAAVVSMTQTMACEWGAAGVRVNAIAPGLIETTFSAAIVGSNHIGSFLERTPLGRVGQPADLGGAAVFLASRASAYVTGHTLVVDGGMSVMGA